MVIMDWSEMCVKYKGLWVALRDKNVVTEVTVVATGKEFKEAEENARKNGYPDAWVVFNQEKNTLWIGGWHEIELSDVQLPKKV